MSRVRILAICLATAAVAIEAIAVGKLTWIAPSLALTFTLYAYIKKHVAIAALDGMLLETALLSPVALACMVWWASHGMAAFGNSGTLTDALLLGAGPLTAVPLALFAAGARRIRLTTLAFVQYIAPSMALLLAVFVFGESFTSKDGLIFGLVWLALLGVALEGRDIRFWRSRSLA
jgi:chloramphenicol-sensitive protein RarD